MTTMTAFAEPVAAYFGAFFHRATTQITSGKKATFVLFICGLSRFQRKKICLILFSVFSAFETLTCVLTIT